jgi:GlpG protein
MRRIGTIPIEGQARQFADYLVAQGIACKLEPSDSAWAVWVRDEERLEQGRRELAEFLAEPTAQRYADAASQADRVRREEAARAKQFRKNYVEVREDWFGPRLRRAPLTFALIIASVVAALATNFGYKMEPVARYLLISNYQVGSPSGHLPEVRQGEVWRLVTPIFLHMSEWHLFFNMYALYVLGRMVELRRGTWRMALLVLAAAVLPNVAQYLVSGPIFGGMSGVVYALFGFAWLRGRLDPSSGLQIDPANVILFIVWSVLGVSGYVGNIANTAHGVGFAVGAVAAVAPLAWRKR